MLIPLILFPVIALRYFSLAFKAFLFKVCLEQEPRRLILSKQLNAEFANLVLSYAPGIFVSLLPLDREGLFQALAVPLEGTLRLAVLYADGVVLGIVMELVRFLRPLLLAVKNVLENHRVLLGVCHVVQEFVSSFFCLYLVCLVFR